MPNDVLRGNDTTSMPLAIHSDSEESDPLLVVPAAYSTESSNDEACKATSVTTKVKLSQWLAFYVRFCSSTGNRDKLLKVLQWSLCCFTSSAWANKVSGEISMARYVSRLAELPMAIEAAVNSSWTIRSSSNGQKNRSRGGLDFRDWAQEWIGRLLSYSMIGYYPTEYVAYGLWLKPITKSSIAADSSSSFPGMFTRTANQWSAISCRFWLAYIVGEMAQCLVQYKALRQTKLQMLAAKKTDEVYEGDASEQEIDYQLSNLKIQLLRDGLFLLPCIHWSLPQWDTKPWMRTGSVNSLMWAEAIVSLYQSFRNS